MKKPIKPELYQKLLKLNEKKMGLDSFIKNVVAEGQRTLGEFQTEQMKIWEQIAKDTGVNLRETDWAPSQDEPNTIVLIQQRYFAN